MPDIAGALACTSESQPPGRVRLFIFGVGMPVAALVVELTMRLSAEYFFDPLPTFFHVLLVASVAAANLWGWIALRREEIVHARRLALAIGFAIGVALLYSIFYFPVLPLGTLGILYFGLGVLVWAPLASLIVALRLRTHFSRRVEPSGGSFRTGAGVALGLLAMIALDVPAAITRLGAGMAVSDTTEIRARGMRLLRTLGSEDALLRLCYARSGKVMSVMSFLMEQDRPLGVVTARQLYYRLTGNAFDSVPVPTGIRNRESSFGWNSPDPELWLASSRIDGSVSADAALGYLEWTMVFKNSSGSQREARTQISLPPGAVVSRVTLWIEGEEREAAFAGRREVTEAYQAVVSQRRDPVLVTSAGADRVSMQLFPVPPQGEMKVRIGITAPLALPDLHEGVLRLPYFNQRNFEVRDDLRHRVWVESKSRLHGTFHADVEDARLSDSSASISAERSDLNSAWAEDARDEGYVVRQVIGHHGAMSGVKQLVIVVDGSQSMRAKATELGERLAKLPPDVRVQLLFAHDAGLTSAVDRVLSGVEVGKRISSFDYAGGHDNTAALVRSLDLASQRTNTVLLWIHGPQPVMLEAEEDLLQRLSHGGKSVKWYDLQLAPGPNLVAEKLDGIARIETLRTIDDVARVLSPEPRLEARRERIETSASALPAADRTSDHVVRLWANDEVARLIHDTAGHRAEALALAQTYQLVTPVSGAVVLETKQQYDDAGLQPVAEGSVPTIPEPEEWALIVAALLALAYAYRRRHAIDARFAS